MTPHRPSPSKTVRCVPSHLLRKEAILRNAFAQQAAEVKKLQEENQKLKNENQQLRHEMAANEAVYEQNLKMMEEKIRVVVSAAKAQQEATDKSFKTSREKMRRMEETRKELDNEVKKLKEKLDRLENPITVEKLRAVVGQFSFKEVGAGMRDQNKVSVPTIVRFVRGENAAPETIEALTVWWRDLEAGKVTAHTRFTPEMLAKIKAKKMEIGKGKTKGVVLNAQEQKELLDDLNAHLYQPLKMSELEDELQRKSMAQKKNKGP